MNTIGDTKISEQRVVIFPALAPFSSAGKQISFLLSVNQVEDVIKQVPIRPVPFSPPWVDGIAQWRDHVAPVISLEACLGLDMAYPKQAERLLLVKAAKAGGREGIEKRAMIKTGATIRMMAIPDTRPVSAMNWVPRSHLVKGVYEWDAVWLVVVDLNRILDGEIQPV